MKTTTLRSTMIPFAVPAGAPLLEGRWARRSAILSFNNVREVVRGLVTLPAGGIVDGFFFHATNATARGISKATGLSVFWLADDAFVAVSL